MGNYFSFGTSAPTDSSVGSIANPNERIRHQFIATFGNQQDETSFGSFRDNRDILVVYYEPLYIPDDYPKPFTVIILASPQNIEELKRQPWYTNEWKPEFAGTVGSGL
jgi:hypothetical protein